MRCREIAKHIEQFFGFLNTWPFHSTLAETSEINQATHVEAHRWKSCPPAMLDKVTIEILRCFLLFRDGTVLTTSSFVQVSWCIMYDIVYLQNQQSCLMLPSFTGVQKRCCGSEGSPHVVRTLNFPFLGMTMRWWRFYQGIPYFLPWIHGRMWIASTPSKPWKERIIGWRYTDFPLNHAVKWVGLHGGSQTSGGSCAVIWKTMVWGPNIPKPSYKEMNM